MASVNVGVVGVGNCASSLVQGLEYYAGGMDGRAGLTNPVCAGCAVSDVRVVSAIDVDAAKIGVDLSEAIWARPNNALRFADVPRLGVRVVDGVVGDGLGDEAAAQVRVRGMATRDELVAHLRATSTDVVVSFLPVGAQRASEFYADVALLAGCAFVNCMPAVIARSGAWVRRFTEAGLPLLGDDLKSQFGSTLVHRALADVLAENGATLNATYQLNSGGNMDFLAMQDVDRMRSKQTSKASAMQRSQGSGFPAERVHVGAEYVPFLADRKTAYIRIEAESFGGTAIEVEVRMSVEDSPSAAGNVLDAVRHMKAAMDRGVSGVVGPVAHALMKAPPTG